MENIIHYYAKCINLLDKEKYPEEKTKNLLREFKNDIIKYYNMGKKESFKETVTMSLQKYEEMISHIEDLHKKNEKLSKQLKENNKIYESNFFSWNRVI